MSSTPTKTRLRGALALAALALALQAAGCGGPTAAARGQPASAVASGEAAAPGALGVEGLEVRLRAAGYLAELRFRVVEAARAAPLFDPGVRLEVLREAGGPPLSAPLQTRLWPAGRPEAGRAYAIELDNTDRRLAAGDRVTVAFGPLRARGLVVGE